MDRVNGGIAQDTCCQECSPVGYARGLPLWDMVRAGTEEQEEWFARSPRVRLSGVAAGVTRCFLTHVVDALKSSKVLVSGLTVARFEDGHFPTVCHDTMAVFVRIVVFCAGDHGKHGRLICGGLFLSLSPPARTLL